MSIMGKHETEKCRVIYFESGYLMCAHGIEFKYLDEFARHCGKFTNWSRKRRVENFQRINQKFSASLNRAWIYCPNCFMGWKKSYSECPNCHLKLLIDKPDQRRLNWQKNHQ